MLGRVLVIDDNELAGRAIASHLEHSVPCETAWTNDSNKAITSDGAPPYDLFVTDLRMPVRDGLTVLAELKARRPECEVIVITAFGELASAKSAMRIGALDYCIRDIPESLKAIADSVRHALMRKPSRRAPGFHREHLIDFFFDRLGIQAGLGSGLLPQGVALEYLTKLLLDSCHGFSTDWMRAKSKTEEIDLVCMNKSDDAFWMRQGPLVLVECKDKDKKAGANERSRFETKVARRHPQSNLGIFVSTSGFASTFTPAVVRTDPPIILHVDKSDLQAWIAAEDRLAWLTKKAVDQIIH
jgi:CheY-like chemotaxis protein